jgi:drug/metabolite transporter (DMT)-like permease
MDPVFRPRTLTALVVTILLWGSAFPALRAVLPAFPPGELAAARYLVTSLALVVVALAARPPRPRRADLPRLVLLGAIGICLYNLAVNAGQRTVAAGPGSFIVNTAPVFSSLAAVLWLGERLRPAGWLGMLTSLSGIGLIAFGEGPGLAWSAGVAEMAAAAVLWSAYSVLQKPLLPTYGAVGVVCYAAWSGTLMLVPFMPSALACAEAASVRDLALTAYLAIAPSAIAFTTWSYAIAKAPVTRVMPFLYAVPVVALTVGWLWLGEAPGALSLAGCALIIAGLVVANRWGTGPTPILVASGAPDRSSGGAATR